MNTKQQPEELLILVNEHDQILGYDSKETCHVGEGKLHRAFSLFLFNDRGQLLLQKRSAQKALWPLFWSNSVCSHPRQGEGYEEAILRRVKEELGFETSLQYLFKFPYQAAFKSVGSENELCSVYIGKINGQTIQADPDEIAEWKYIDIEELNNDLVHHSEQYTPWFKIEWARIQKRYYLEIKNL